MSGVVTEKSKTMPSFSGSGSGTISLTWQEASARPIARIVWMFLNIMLFIDFAVLLFTFVLFYCIALLRPAGTLTNPASGA